MRLTYAFFNYQEIFIIAYLINNQHFFNILMGKYSYEFYQLILNFFIKLIDANIDRHYEINLDNFPSILSLKLLLFKFRFLLKLLLYSLIEII
jgi:hypothetical protein